MLKHIYKEENIMGLWDSLNRVAERAAYEMEKKHDKFESGYESAQDMSDSQLMRKVQSETDQFKRMGYAAELKRRREN